MEIREFAERILYGTRLEDKLVSAAGLTDDRPGTPRYAPDLPGRPEALRLDRPRERVPFPGVHELDRPGMRGRVLHFFANHELLATELMALALLRFPEAPAGFRAGLVRTIEEEQRHLRLYHERMRADGVELGEIPVSSFFWDCMRGMERPIDFVAGMSLTFEQANLDYARYYAEAFRAAGDTETADVLDVVYREEIGHVKHGAVWFERWREPSVTAFEAWCAVLQPPLTPARGRGLRFDRDGRRQAGLDEDFIRRVEVAGESRGRPPVVHVFNPSCDHRWLHGERHPLPAAARAIEEDLETVPALLARTDDCVLVRRRPTPAFLQHLAGVGCAVPDFVVDADPLGPPPLSYRHLAAISPWGWDHDTARRFRAVRDRLPSEERALEQRASVAARVNRKSFAVPLLRAALQAGEEPRLSSESSVGLVLRDPRSAIAELTGRAEEARLPVVVKGDHGASGRNHLRVRSTSELELARSWIENAFRHQPAVVLEPWLTRCVDLGVVGAVDGAGEVTSPVVTRFLTDARGQYQGAIVGRPWFGLGEELVRFCHGDGGAPRFVARTMAEAARTVGRALHAEGYAGPFGVDAMIHREGEHLRLRPIVEVNARVTMGHVAAALASRLAGGAHGLWLLLRREDVGDFSAFAQRLSAAAPADIPSPGKRPCLRGGVLFGNDPQCARRVLAVMVVGRTVASVLAPLGAAGGDALRRRVEALLAPGPAGAGDDS